MLLAYINLPQRRKRILFRQRTEQANPNDSPSQSDIQMVDLIMDKASSSNVKSNANLSHNDCMDQKINSFEFHQADDDDNDGNDND